MELNGYYVTSVKATTKKGEELQNAFDFSDCFNTELGDVYGRFSRNKLDAITYCKDMELAFNGYCGRITSYNTFMFCYAFLFKYNGVESLAYITPSYNYVVIGCNVQ